MPCIRYPALFLLFSRTLSLPNPILFVSVFAFIVLRYSSFVKNMDKKYKTKRQRPQESSEDEEDEEATKKQKTPNKIVGQVKTFLKPKEYQWYGNTKLFKKSARFHNGLSSGRLFRNWWYSCNPVERNWGDGHIITLEREFVVPINNLCFWMSFLMGCIRTNTMLFFHFCI